MNRDNKYRKSIELEGRGATSSGVSSDKLKVAIVLMHFNYGGGERMVSLLASHLDLSRFDVHVFCVYGDPHDNVMERAVLDHGVPITYIRKGLGFSFKYLVKVWRALSSYSPDVVHTHLGASVYCASWALFRKGKLLHTLHNIPEKESGRSRSRVMRLLYKTGKAVPIAISDTNRRLTADFYGLPIESVEAVVNPVDIEAFSDKDPKPWDERRFDFIHVARFEEVKNHIGLVRAVARLASRCPGGASIKVALVGEGPLEREVMSEVRRLGLDQSVVFLGVRDDVAELMHDSKCFVLPSFYEGLPMTILEAMSAGLPVIATSVGGVPDVVQDGRTGMLVPPDDEEALVAAMERMLDDDVLDWMGAEAKSKVAPYSCVSVAEKYGALYRKYGRR